MTVNPKKNHQEIAGSTFTIRGYQKIYKEQLEGLGLPAKYISQYTNSPPLYQTLKCLGLLTSYLYLMTEEGSTKVWGTIVVRQRFSLAGGYRWKIHAVYVSPELRGKGFGVALVHHALQELSEQRATEVSLKVDEDNAPAIGLYKKCGFAESAARDGQLILVKRLAA